MDWHMISCESVPTSCPTGGTPVCGCDGVVRANECLAAQDGVDLGTDCTTPAGRFKCGPYMCDGVLEIKPYYIEFCTPGVREPEVWKAE